MAREAFELGHALAEGGVLGLELGERGGGLRSRVCRQRAMRHRGEQTCFGLAAHQGAAADRAEAGFWRRTCVTRRDFQALGQG